MAMNKSTRMGIAALIVVIVVVVSAIGAYLLVVQPGKGKVSVYVKDAPVTSTWSHVNVTFSTVQIHAANASGVSGWLNLSVSVHEIDLASLVNVSELLASGKVQPGKYTMIRLVVTNVTGTMVNGTKVYFTVPSGELKTTHPFNVTAGSTTKLTVDIDLSKSIVHENGVWKFKPVLGAIEQS